MKTLNFDGCSLACLTNQNIESAIELVANRAVDGLFIAEWSGYSLEDLRCLEKFTGLRMLVLDELHYTQIGNIGELTGIEYLSIGNVAGSIDLCQLRNLVSLRLRIAKGRSLPNKILEKLQNLAVWELAYENLKCLGSFPALKSLEIIQAGKLKEMNGIEACLNIEKLLFAYCKSMVDISAIHALKKLKTLEINRAKKIEDLSQIGQCVSLIDLKLEKLVNVKDFDFIGDLHNLENLVIRGSKIKSKFFSAMMKLQFLKYVYFDQEPAVRDEVKKLNELIAKRSTQFTLVD